MRVAVGSTFLITGVLLCVVSPLWCAPARSCIQNDPSATFSANLGLPPAQSDIGIKIREAILGKDFAAAQALVEKMGPPADSWLWRGVLLLQRGKTYAAIRSLEQSAQLQDTSTVEMLLAVAYLLLNQRLLVQDALHAALQMEPQNPRALYLQGRLDFMTHSYERAIRNFAAVLGIEPNDYSSLYYLGFSELNLGRNDSARDHLMRAVDVLNCHHLDFWMAPYALAKLELDSGAFAPALEHTKLALEMARSDPDQADSRDESAEVLVLQGRIESSLGRENDAERDWRHAVELNPTLGSGWYQLGLLLQRQGRKAESSLAMQHFQESQ